MEWDGLDRTLRTLHFVTPYSVTYMYVGTYWDILYWASSVFLTAMHHHKFSKQRHISERILLLCSAINSILTSKRRDRVDRFQERQKLTELVFQLRYKWEYLGRKA